MPSLFFELFALEADAIVKRASRPREPLEHLCTPFSGRYAQPMSSPDEILEFWFGPLDDEGLASKVYSKRWFEKSDGFDNEVRERFEEDYRVIAGDDREDWLQQPLSWLAYILVLDQFARNMFRGRAQMYAEDDRALRAATAGLYKGFDRTLSGDHRVFCYMPLMHAESLEHQDRCVQLFEAFAEEASPGALKDRLRDNHKYALWHRDIVRDWGRFPHRNAILGRESTPEEQAFLNKPGSSF